MRCKIVIVVLVVVAVVVVVILIAVVVGVLIVERCRSRARIRRWFAVCHGLRHGTGDGRATVGEIGKRVASVKGIRWSSG